MSATAQMLADVPLFAMMSARERKALAEKFELAQYSKGETIFEHGDPGDSLLIVRSGRLQVYVENKEGQKIVLSEVEPGEFLGEISLFDPGPRTATAVAVEDSEVLTLDHDHLLDVIQRQPKVAADLLAVMGKRLRATDELVRTQASRNVNEVIEIETTPLQRVADWIAEFSGSMPFLMLNAMWFGVWIGINTLDFGIRQFDPFPFGLLTMIVSLEAIFLSCFVLISQNRSSEKDRIKSDLDYQVNLKAELEVSQLHNKVDKIYEAMQAQFARMEKERKAAEKNNSAGASA